MNGKLTRSERELDGDAPPEPRRKSTKSGRQHSDDGTPSYAMTRHYTPFSVRVHLFIRQSPATLSVHLPVPVVSQKATTFVLKNVL